MSWFGRKREFVEEEDAKADDLEAEFDGIAEAFNGLFGVGRVSSEFTAGGESVVDIKGTSLVLSPAVPSVLLVVAVSGIPSDQTGEAWLNLDGADQTPKLTHRQAQVFALELSAASHTVKMRKKGGQVDASQGGFLYLLIPDPEP